MIRNTSLLLVVALLAATPVLGVDIPFAARVDVLQTLDIATARLDGPAASPTALSMQGTQDQCLDLEWLDGEGATLPQGAIGIGQAVTGLFRLDQDGLGTIEPGSDGLPDGSTLQINLN
jgi:hypothetical protein